MAATALQIENAIFDSVDRDISDARARLWAALVQAARKGADTIGPNTLAELARAAEVGRPELRGWIEAATRRAAGGTDWAGVRTRARLLIERLRTTIDLRRAPTVADRAGLAELVAGLELARFQAAPAMSPDLSQWRPDLSAKYRESLSREKGLQDAHSRGIISRGEAEGVLRDALQRFRNAAMAPQALIGASPDLVRASREAAASERTDELLERLDAVGDPLTATVARGIRDAERDVGIARARLAERVAAERAALVRIDEHRIELLEIELIAAHDGQ